jgi:hypothetical protein
MDDLEELMFEWLRKVWHRRTGAFVKKRGMLVLDTSKVHFIEKVKTVASNLLHTDLVIIPEGITCQVQSLI